MRYEPQSMQVNANTHFSLKALHCSLTILTCLSFKIWELIIWLECRQGTWKNCISFPVLPMLLVTTDIYFILLVYQVFAWKTQTAGALSPPHLCLFLPTWNTSIFWSFWEKAQWLLTVCTVNRIVHRKTKSYEGSYTLHTTLISDCWEFTSCNYGFERLSWILSILEKKACSVILQKQPLRQRISKGKAFSFPIKKQ